MKDKGVFVLIVDDEEVMRSLFTDLLSEYGCNVIAVDNGQEAIEKVKETNFAIIFIDIHMPVMDGVQTLRAIKKIRPQAPVVMMDSFPDILIEKSQREGATVCIHKPFEIKEVIKIMKEIVEGKTEEVG